MIGLATQQETVGLVAERKALHGTVRCVASCWPSNEAKIFLGLEPKLTVTGLGVKVSAVSRMQVPTGLESHNSTSQLLQ